LSAAQDVTHSPHGCGLLGRSDHLGTLWATGRELSDAVPGARPDPGRYNCTARSGKGKNLGGFAASRIGCDPDQTIQQDQGNRS
jgi:hypothetical protein